MPFFMLLIRVYMHDEGPIHVFHRLLYPILLYPIIANLPSPITMTHSDEILSVTVFNQSTLLGRSCKQLDSPHFFVTLVVRTACHTQEWHWYSIGSKGDHDSALEYVSQTIPTLALVIVSQKDSGRYGL